MQALLPVFLLRMLLEVVQSQRKDRTSSKLLLNPKNRHCLPEARRRTSNLLNKVSPPSSSPAATARISTRCDPGCVGFTSKLKHESQDLASMASCFTPALYVGVPTRGPFGPEGKTTTMPCFGTPVHLHKKEKISLSFGRLTFSSKRMGMAAH